MNDRTAKQRLTLHRLDDGSMPLCRHEQDYYLASEVDVEIERLEALLTNAISQYKDLWQSRPR